MNPARKKITSMTHERITVLLPCHSLEDFPVWSRGDEAEDLLAAWTAAWHPALIAGVGKMPSWRGIDRPADGLLKSVAIVPASFDHRFDVTSHESDPADQVAVTTAAVRHLSDVGAIATEAAGLLGVADRLAAVSDDLVEDFYALGLGWLLAELLSRRMRSQSMPEKDAFAGELVAAAKAAMAGDAEEANQRLDACHRHLETARAHYYPVDVWLLDLLLVVSSTLDERLDQELTSLAPSGLIAAGELIDQLAATRPDRAAALKEAVAAGRIEPIGGLWDDESLAGHAPETILDSLTRGGDAWQRGTGRRPVVYGRRTGGSSALLPQLLGSLGYQGAIWNLFDGSPLPDPGSSRIRWTGSGGGAIEALAKPPLDARDASTILGLPEKLGSAMDHEHAVVLVFARYPGTSSPWYERLRRITTRGTVLGRFALPSTVLSETASASITVNYGPDAFRPPLPEATATAAETLVAPRQAARREAAGLASNLQRFQEALGPNASSSDVATAAATASSASSPTAQRPVGLVSRVSSLLPWNRKASSASDEILDNGLVRLRLHPETGGILSLRRSDDTANRLSQRLTRRVTRPPAGSRWQDPLERSDYAGMVADTVGRCEDSPHDTLKSTGRLVDAQGTVVGRFSQRITLPAEASLIWLDIDLQLDEVLSGNPLENYAACRFAWSENDAVDLSRSIHTQSVPSERNVIMAEHFVELAIDDMRRGSEPQRLQIFPLGLPWHVRSHSHMLDTLLLPPGSSSGQFQLVLGVGRERPWDDAIRLMAASESGGAEGAFASIARPPEEGVALDGSARLTPGSMITENDQVVGLRCGLLESAGRRHQARMRFPRTPVAAWRCSADGKRGSSLTIEDGTVVMSLASYEWAFVEVRFVAEDTPLASAGDDA
jgi:hypothetical protein